MKKQYFGWVLIFLSIIPLFIFLAMNKDKPEQQNKEINNIIGFYINGEGFDQKIIDSDIYDTLGLYSNSTIIYYLVDYHGKENSYFFCGKEYSRFYLNLTLIKPYESNELDMGSGESLKSFVEYLFFQKASYYSLIIWGHGNGYVGIGPDHGSYLTPSEIRSSILPHHLDNLILDACGMMSIEVLDEIKDCTDTIIGSEKDIPDRGLDYANGFLDYLSGGDKDFSQCIMDCTKTYYKSHPSKFSLQLVSVNSRELGKFLSDIYDKKFVFINYPESFESGTTYDFGLLLKMNNYNVTLDNLVKIINYQIVLNSSTGLHLDNLSGIGILGPEYTTGIPFYAKVKIVTGFETP